MTQPQQQNSTSIGTLMLGAACTVLTTLVGYMFVWAVQTLGEIPVLNAKLTEQIGTLTRSVNGLQTTLAESTATNTEYRRETMLKINSLEMRMTQLEKDIQKKVVHQWKI